MKIELDEEHAMVVLSGGQDSTTCLGYALSEYGKVSCVTFDYNQKHSIELHAARSVVAFFEKKLGVKISHEVVSLGDDPFAGLSPLTNPEVQLELYSDRGGR